MMLHLIISCSIFCKYTRNIVAYWEKWYNKDYYSIHKVVTAVEIADWFTKVKNCKRLMPKNWIMWLELFMMTL